MGGTGPGLPSLAVLTISMVLITVMITANVEGSTRDELLVGKKLVCETRRFLGLSYVPYCENYWSMDLRVDKRQNNQTITCKDLKKMGLEPPYCRSRSTDWH